MFTVHLRRAMEKKEKRDAQKYALEYKRECDVLRIQLQELKKIHELEITRLEAQYTAEINRLKMECDKLAHEPSTHQASFKSDDEDLKLSVSEVTAHVKEVFSKPCVVEACTMLFHLAMEHDCQNKEIFKLINGLLSAAIQRVAPYQIFNIPNVQQLNMNPQVVQNVFDENKM